MNPLTAHPGAAGIRCPTANQGNAFFDGSRRMAWLIQSR